MQKSVFLNCLVACALIAGACGDDGGGGGEAGSGGGNPAGSNAGGSGGGPTEDMTPPNPECPQMIGPVTGPFAPKGSCCYRTSNRTRIAAQTGDTRTLEYRFNLFLVKNHAATMASLEQLSINRYDLQEQSVLFRITVPWADGKMAAGMGTFQVGAGRYNCGEGTYSFYSATAAPVKSTLMDPQRWEAAVVPVVVNPDAANTADQIKPVWAENMRSRIPAYTPFLKTMAPKALDWESSSQAFTFETSPKLEGDTFDCIGARDESVWAPGGKVRVYVRVDANNQDPITAIGNITLAQLQAFGATPEVVAMKDTPAYNPTRGQDRCMPGTSGCKWAKLPESLCPESADDQTKWGCHVGWAENPDGFKTNCTPDAPTGVLDPDKGAPNEGQCCDPLGKSTTLPACNAWVNIIDFVAAAVEITDQPANEVQQNCAM